MNHTTQRIYEEAYDNLTNSLNLLGLDAALKEINLGQIENFVFKQKAFLTDKILSVFKGKYVYSDTGDMVVFDNLFFEYTLNVKANNVNEFKKAYLKNAHADNLLRYHRILFESNQIRPVDL